MLGVRSTAITVGDVTYEVNPRTVASSFFALGILGLPMSKQTVEQPFSETLSKSNNQ